MHSVGDRVAVWCSGHNRHFTGVITRIYRCRHRSKIWTAAVFNIKWDNDKTPMRSYCLSMRKYKPVNLGEAA